MFTDKFKYIFSAIIYFIGILLICVSSAFTNNVKNATDILVIYLPEALIGGCAIVLCFLSIRYKLGWLIALNILFSAGFCASGAVCYLYLEDGVFYWLNAFGCLAGAVNFLCYFGYYLVRFLLRLGNYWYDGNPPMPYWRKFCEVLLQIALIPFSAFINACWAYFWIGGNYLGGLINQKFFLCLLKGQAVEYGTSYNVGASDKLVETTVTHEVSDGKGHFIGSYDTKEYSVEHDDGERYDFSGQFIYAMWSALIALPLRIISLLLSIIALFVPKMYVSAIKLSTHNNYNEYAYLWLDIIVDDQEKNNNKM